MLFRFGGEEFVLIVRCPDQATCLGALERFRSTVERTTFPQVGTVTISLSAVRMSHVFFIATLLDYSNHALYHCKHSGRNCTTFFEDMVNQGLAKTEEITPGDIEFF